MRALSWNWAGGQASCRWQGACHLRGLDRVVPSSAPIAPVLGRNVIQGLGEPRLALSIVTPALSRGSAYNSLSSPLVRIAVLHASIDSLSRKA